MAAKSSTSLAPVSESRYLENQIRKSATPSPPRSMSQPDHEFPNTFDPRLDLPMTHEKRRARHRSIPKLVTGLILLNLAATWAIVPRFASATRHAEQTAGQSAAPHRATTKSPIPFLKPCPSSDAS